MLTAFKQLQLFITCRLANEQAGTKNKKEYILTASFKAEAKLKRPIQSHQHFSKSEISLCLAFALYSVII
jgi:hypothetical protein